VNQRSAYSSTEIFFFRSSVQCNKSVDETAVATAVAATAQTARVFLKSSRSMQSRFSSGPSLQQTCCQCSHPPSFTIALPRPYRHSRHSRHSTKQRAGHLQPSAYKLTPSGGQAVTVDQVTHAQSSRWTTLPMFQGCTCACMVHG
jgi:hypothetical protein